MMRSAVCFVFLFIFLSGCLSSESIPSQPQSASPRICFPAVCVNVEVADTPAERELGLMNRDHLDENAGMLFVFETEGTHSFWMKSTLIPLDAIWINGKYQVVDIQSMIPCTADPCTIYTPAQIALYVVEVNPAFVETNHIRVGDFIQFKGV